MAGMHAIIVANLMSEATAPCTGRPVINARVLIIPKPFVVPRLQQPRQRPTLTGARSHNCRRDVHLLGATMAIAKEVADIIRRRRHQRNHQSRKPLEGLYTDTDQDNRSEIITDITIRVPGKAGTMMMEVKVDPGVQPSCIPLHKFKTLFVHLCRDGLPREGLLDNTQNEFQSYNGGDMMCYGHFLIDVKDKVTKKYHPIRFYVMNTDMPRILISHAASHHIG